MTLLPYRVEVVRSKRRRKTGSRVRSLPTGTAVLEPPDDQPLSEAGLKAMGDAATVIRSAAHPEREIRDWRQFEALRRAYDAARNLPSPRRGWQPWPARRG